MDLPTKIVAEHLAARITDLEVELAEQAAGAVVEGLVFVDGVDKLPTAVAGVRFAANGVVDASSRQRSTANASGRVESMTVLGLVLLNPGQYVELWVTDESGTGSVTITDLQVTIAAVAG